jgi:hypothetical protein
MSRGGAARLQQQPQMGGAMAAAFAKLQK